MHVRVKICGVTRPRDAKLAAQLGADAIGMVFAVSPRRVDISRAKAIVREIPPWVARVGVFRDQGEDEIRKTVKAVDLDYAQIHTPVPPGVWKLGRKVVPAVSCPDGRIPTRLPGTPSSPLLLDSGGGTGRSWNYRAARGLATHRPVILAGGLRPGNVRRAIQEVRPYAVDVSSGVESSPGKKDFKKMRDFVTAVRVGESRL